MLALRQHPTPPPPQFEFLDSVKFYLSIIFLF